MRERIKQQFETANVTFKTKISYIKIALLRFYFMFVKDMRGKILTTIK